VAAESSGAAKGTSGFGAAPLAADTRRPVAVISPWLRIRRIPPLTDAWWLAAPG